MVISKERKRVDATQFSVILSGMSEFRPDELLTPTQAARLKGVSRQWITNLIRDGRLPAVSIAGRNFVRQKDVLNYAASIGRPPGKVSTENKAATAKPPASSGASVKKKGKK